MKHKFARIATIALALISVFCANFATADAGYSFWKWLHFGSDSDSTDFTIYLPNVAPNAPVLVAPADESYVADSTPQLSVTYSDSDTGDTGTTNYRIAVSSKYCSAGTDLIASGTSAETSSASAVTTWSPTTAIDDGTYFWCAQNDDGADTSEWTTGVGDGWSFTLDTSSPVILDGSTLASDNSTITITFSTGVYTESNGTGDLIAGDFTATLTSNSGGATAATITSVDHTAGSSTAVVHLSYTGTATGVETVTVMPSSGESIYNLAGNAMEAAQSTGAKTLNDITAPTIVSIDSDKDNGSYTTGATIDLDITFSEAVTSTGLVALTLETGTIDRVCSFSVSSSTTATCNYIVQSGDVSADLDVSSVSGVIADAAGNALTNFTPATNLAANKALVVDAKIPDIVAVDAGASSGDRSSLTSDSWFGYSAIGSDDQVSFSWTDSSSSSDDTFYYELNADSGNTISGNESSVTTNYVDSVTVSEGTRYFHVRPKNGAATWGTERVFIVKYDKSAPTTSAAVSAGTLGNSDFYTSNPSVTLTPADSGSGIATTVYCTDTANSCTPTTSYTAPITLSTAGTNYVRYLSTDSAGNAQAAQSLSVKVDTTAPAGGSAAHADGYQTSATVAVTVASGSDATSGMSTTDSDYLLEYRAATLSSGTCGTYGSWTDAGVTETAAGTDYNFTATTGNCYQFRYTVTDVAGNTGTFTSSNTTKVDTAAPVNPTLDFTDGYTTLTSQSVAFGATDAASGVSAYTLSTQTATLSSASCGAYGDWSSLGAQTSPYEHSLTSGKCYKYQIVVADAAGNSTTYISAATTKVDYTAPTGGSVSHTNGYQTSTTIAVAVDRGSDAQTSMSAASSDYLLEYRSATLAAGSCGSYGSWTDAGITESAAAANYNFTATTANCYQFRYSVADTLGNSATFTSSDTTKVDIATPDITAVDAGASSSDRTSLTSDSWFAAAAAGGDDQISFSWTDAASTSDDTYFYELNTTATATISGDESSATTNYIDSIAIAEGTSYFHVRPQNGAGTFGTERIFTVKYDKSDPSVSTPADEGAVSVDQTLEFTWTAASDTYSGLASLTLCIDDDKTGDCAKEVSLATDATGYDWSADPAPTWGVTYYAKLTAVDAVGNSATSSWSDGVTPDGNPPSVSADKASADWYIADQTVTLSASDAESGLNQARYAWDTNNLAADCASGGTVFTDATQIAFSTEGSHTLYLCAVDNAANTATWNGTYKLDKTNPASGSVTHTDGFQATATIAVTVDAGADSVSGLSTADSDYLLEYHAATLSAGSCGSYGSWTDAGVAETAAATNYNFTATTANCYQFRYTVSDTAGNSATFTSTDTTKVDTSTPDIVVVDAGASSLDRTSLESADWFKYSDTGSDDQISFSWTDANSVSDDTYFYELNSTATATVTGDESSAATSYIDSITITEGTNYFHVRPQNGAGTFGTERIFTVNYDKTDPTVQTTTLTSPNGSEIWTGGGDATYEITWSSADFTDATSGLATSPITLEYSTDSGSQWTTIATGEANDGSYTWTTPDLSDAEMQIRVTAVDLAGNTASDTSDADFRLSAHDNWIALHLIEGDNQLGGIEETLATDLKMRVGNGADSGETFAAADDVTVSFTLNSVPESPTATGQALANGSFGTTFGGTSVIKTATTDASGYVSAVLTLGDRAGEYIVIANFTGAETAEADRTFTAIEREVFQMTFVPVNLNLDLDPSVDAVSADSTVVSITANAASFTLTANPQTWLAAGEEMIGNWDGSLGFGWDNNDSGTSGGVTEITAFSGLATPTTVFTCSGDSCQGSQDFTLDFHSQIDYIYGAGNYENSLEIDAATVNF